VTTPVKQRRIMLRGAPVGETRKFRAAPNSDFVGTGLVSA